MNLDMKSGAEAHALQALARWSGLRACGTRSVWSAPIHRRFSPRGHRLTTATIDRFMVTMRHEQFVIRATKEPLFAEGSA